MRKETVRSARGREFAGTAMLWLYALLSAGCLLALYVPWPEALALIPTLMEFVPGWLLLLPAIPTALLLRQRAPRLALAALVLINTVVFLDFQIPARFGREPPGLQIRIATYNIGNGPIRPEEILAWYADNELDALMIQETQAFKPQSELPNSMNYLCGGRLCVLTQHQIEKLESLSRHDFKGGWGSYIARFDLSLGGETVALYNVHLNTPRHELEYLRGFITGAREASRLYGLRKLESQIASAMVAQHPQQRRHTVIAGDFNLSPRGAIYREYWSPYTNAFSRAGLGMGYSKRTRLLGARIDHILVNDAVGVSNARVGKSLGGDHRPLVAELSLR